MTPRAASSPPSTTTPWSATLVADTIAEGVGSTVSDTVRETVAAVAALASAEGVMARAVADKLRLDKSNVSRRLRMAADGGYIRNLEDKRGKPGRWVIGDPLPESVDLLPDPAQLATADTPPDLRGCAVALESEGENGDPSSNGFIRRPVPAAASRAAGTSRPRATNHTASKQDPRHDQPPPPRIEQRSIRPPGEPWTL